MRAQKRAVSAWRERYISVNADSQSAAASVIEKSVNEMDETRRTRTLAPKASISNAVKAVGTAYAEKLYAAGSVKAMVIVDARHCEGRGSEKSSRHRLWWNVFMDTRGLLLDGIDEGYLRK